MTKDDRDRWDARYTEAEGPLANADNPPDAFRGAEHHFPITGTALDVACGPGGGSVWLARRGLTVWGVDVSSVAIERANQLADDHEVQAQCRFDVVDLDVGLPDGPPVDVLLCHLFRGQNLTEPMVERLTPGGVLAVAVLSEVGAEPGLFRAPPGELVAAFGHLEILDQDEADGRAWIIARQGRVLR